MSAPEGPGARDDPGSAGEPPTPAPDGPTAPVSGPDLVRAALARARADARSKGLVPGGAPGARPKPRRGGPGSGAARDARDPVLLGSLVRRLVHERGWQAQTSAARVLGDWSSLVGPELAEHCRPASLVDGALVLVAESTAWATQVRLLSRTLQARLTAQLGADVVTSVTVRGPTSQDWRRGPRRVRGRGPRDTYG